MTTTEIPNPGSDAAIEMGCKCPVIDNNHGIGGCFWGPGVWVYSGLCPIHKVVDDE